MIEFSNSLEQAKRHLKNSVNLIDFTLRVMGDNKILAKSLVELQKSVSSIIECYLIKSNNPVSPSQEEKANIFFEKIAKKELSKEQIEELDKILRTAKRHKESHMEFVKNEKLVIFHEQNYIILTEKRLKNSINVVKEIVLQLTKKT